MTPPSQDFIVTVAKIEANLQNSYKCMEEVKDTLKEYDKKVEILTASLNQAKGAIWIACALSGVIFSCFTAITIYKIKDYDTRIAALENAWKSHPPTRKD